MTESQPGRMRPTGHEEAIRLLATTPYGRIVFTERALPAVSPARHVVDGEHVIVCAHPGAAMPPAGGQVVAYQADCVGVGALLHWSVVVIGVAEDSAGDVIRIRPELVSGQVLVEGELPATA